MSGPGQQLVGERRAPRPERRRPLGQLLGGGEVDDERVAGRPALHREEPPDRRLVAGVGAEAVHGLGRERDEPAGPQHGDRRRSRRLDRRRQAGTASRNSRAASMKANDSGVAKWSVPFSTTSRASGSSSVRGSPGPAKSLSPMQTRTGQVMAARRSAVRAWWTGRCSTAARACGVVARLVGVLREQLGADVGVGAVARHRVDDAAQAVGVLAEEVGADAADHDAPEALGRAAGQLEQRGGAQREPDRVDLPLRGEGVDDAGGQVGVGLGIVRLGRRAVAEQVDADHGAPGVLQERLPPRSLPRGGERPAPAMDEHHRFRAHGRTLPNAARPRLGRGPSCLALTGLIRGTARTETVHALPRHTPRRTS